MTTDDKRHPEAMSKTCCCDEEDHKTSSEANVKDLYLVVRETLSVIRSEREGSVTVVRKTVSVIREMVRLGEIYRSSQKRSTISRSREIYGRIGKNRKA